MESIKKVLVTGGLGYIGAHTVVELEKAGYQTVIVDDLSNSDSSVLDRLNTLLQKDLVFYKADVTNASSVQAIFEQHSIEGIIHFAASKAVGESVVKPLLYYRNNLLSAINLLESMVKYDVENFIFSSSCTVYGEPDELPVVEDTPIKPALSPYGNTKQICEEIISDATRANADLQAISLRYFNPIGAHASGLIGELPLGIPNNLVPYLLKVVSGELELLSVFGDDYDTPDGTCIRDYIHVVDLAKAHVVALNRLLAGENRTNHEFFNIGTGRGYSVLELIQTFEQVNSQKVNYRIANRREGDIKSIYANTTLANHELGWKAEEGLEEMLRSAWHWQKEINQQPNKNEER